jgi:thiamine biosynthesis lipoprotein
VEESKIAMGTKWHIKLYASDPQRAAEDISSAWNKLSLMDSLWSNYRSDSELHRINELAGSEEMVKLHALSSTLYREAFWYSEISRGIFDPTIGPAAKIWRRAFKLQEWPSKESIDEVKALVNYHRVKLENDQLSLLEKGMSLDLGGIAKGFAVDVLMDDLKSKGYASVLIDGGGDICASGSPEGATGWSVSVPELDMAAQLTDHKTSLANSCVATSGNTFQYIEHNDLIYQHHLDPITCLAISNVHRVTVWANSGVAADAISTILSIEPNFQIDYPHFNATIITGKDLFIKETINN